MYMADHIFLVIPIKYLINEYSKPTIPSKLAAGTKPSISHLFVLSCLCVLRKATACWYKGVKYVPLWAKGFLGYLIWNYTASKKGIFFTYHLNVILYICTMSFLVRVSLVFWCKRHNHIQKQCLCYLQCHTYHMLNIWRKNWWYNHVCTVWRGEFTIGI